MKKKYIIFLIIIFVVLSLFFVFLNRKYNHITKQKDDEIINICFSIDDNYVKPMLVTIYSLLKNNKSNSVFHFYIFTEGLKEENSELIKKFLEYNLCYLYDFIKIDTSVVSKGRNLYENEYHSGYIKDITLAKVLIPSSLPQNIHKCLYLDSDLIILGDIKDIYNITLDKDYIVGMVLDYWKGSFNSDYYCAGVILFDLDKWRGYDIDSSIRNFIQSKFFYRVRFGEQDILNWVLNEKIKRLDDNYSLVNDAKSERKYRYKHPYIIHYTGRYKPWRDFSDKIYDSYLEKTEVEIDYINKNKVGNTK